MQPRRQGRAGRLSANGLGGPADRIDLLGEQRPKELSATAFVTRDPAVTSAIIGPGTMEHLDAYLAADGIDLPVDLLDRIDQIVPPRSRSTSLTTCGASEQRR